MTHKLYQYHQGLLSTIRQEVRELYASVAFADMASALAVLFEPIILYYVLGLGIIQILLFMAAVYAIQTLLLPLGAAIASRYGYLHTVFLSIPFMAIYWLLLYGAKIDMSLLYFAPFIYGIEKALFWPAFHAVAARYVDSKRRTGAPLATTTATRDGLWAMVITMRILGPLIGGTVGYTLGLGVVLLLAAGMYMTSLLPLLLSQEIYAPSNYSFAETWEIYKKFPRRFVSYLGAGEEVLIMTIWPILVFLYLGNVAWVGFVVSVSAAVTALLILALKRPTDLSSKLLMLKVGSFVYTMVNLLRLAVTGFYGLFVADALGRTSKELISLPLTTLTYERAEKTQTLAYVVFYQQSAAFGKFLAATAAVLVFGFTGSIIAVFVLAGCFTLLYMLG